MAGARAMGVSEGLPLESRPRNDAHARVVPRRAFHPPRARSDAASDAASDADDAPRRMFAIPRAMAPPTGATREATARRECAGVRARETASRALKRPRRTTTTTTTRSMGAGDDAGETMAGSARADERARRVLDGPKPTLIVDLGAGTVKVAPTRRQKSAATTVREQAVKRVSVEMKNKGNVNIGMLEAEDVDDATNLVMDLFFKVRPQDILAKNRLRFEQSQRVRGGLLDGVQKAEDRILIGAKVGSVLVGIAEVSLPNGNRFGADRLQPRAPKDKAYLSDVCVSPTQRGRGIGKQLVLAAERAMVNMGENILYTHTKVDNEAAQILFEKCGYEEPPEIKATLTSAQIAQRSSKNNPFAKLGLVDVGHILLAKPLTNTQLPP